MFQIALANQDFFLIVRRFHNHASKRIAEERSTPEFQAFTLSTVAANISELMTHAIDHADKNAISNGVRTLDGAPRIVLHRSELGFFVRVPPDGSRIKEYVGAL